MFDQAEEEMEIMREAFPDMGRQRIAAQASFPIQRAHSEYEVV
jgi:hypothetical protein